jgi:hypothetical protein
VATSLSKAEVMDLIILWAMVSFNNLIFEARDKVYNNFKYYMIIF